MYKELYFVFKRAKQIFQNTVACISEDEIFLNHQSLILSCNLVELRGMEKIT